MVGNAQAAINNADPHLVWKRMKKVALNHLAKGGHRADTTTLEKQFDQGLGKLLDGWTAELNKFPKQDAAKLQAIRETLTAAMTRYREMVGKAKLGGAAPLLLSALDALDKALTLQLQIVRDIQRQVSNAGMTAKV
jgi:molecular chaperone GrpE (heat shock protein)